MQVPREIQDMIAEGLYGIGDIDQQPSVEPQSPVSCGKSVPLKSLGRTEVIYRVSRKMGLVLRGHFRPLNDRK